MTALRPIVALLLADLRQRLRAPRLWLVAAGFGIAMWWCFPAIQADYLTVSVGDGMRARYSSAWVGMIAALLYSSLFSLIGFYLVRGTVTRDLETRTWQLLVATTMSRSGYLVAKWLSHIMVFVLVMSAGLAVGLLAQWLRAEDRHIDLLELVKPVLLLTLPSLAFTAALAVWFDLVPWLRRTAGNVLFFVLWLALLGFGVSQAEQAPGATLPWPGDPHGLLVAEYDLSRAWPMVDSDAELGLSVGKQALEGHAPVLLEWKRWPVTVADLRARLSWLALALVVLLAATPFLDRFAAHAGVPGASRGSGSRLRWLDAVLAPLQRTPFGALVAAELRLVLRPRRAWWWLAMAGVLVAQGVATDKPLVIAMVAGWLLSIDVFARLALREHDTRTGALVFSAPRIRARLLLARVLVSIGLACMVVLPGLLRLAFSQPLAAAAALAIAASIALWGLASGALFRNSRPFELCLLMAGYVSVQGAWALNALVAPATTLAWHTALLPLAAVLLVVGWRRAA